MVVFALILVLLILFCFQCITLATLLEHDYCNTCNLFATSLQSEDGKRERLTSIVHSGDNYNEAAIDICAKLPIDLQSCQSLISSKLNTEDWIQHFSNLYLNSNQLNLQLSRFQYITIIQKLRKYQNPRRLLVIGADSEDMNLWNRINIKQSGGTTVFLSRNLLLSSNNPLIRTNYDIELQLNTSIIELNSYYNEIYDEITADYRFMNFDCIILYDLCNNINNFQYKIKCIQLYLEYSIDIVSDDGYLFIQINNSNLEETIKIYDLISIEILENKFLYRHEISTHIDDKSNIIIYYTSQVTFLQFIFHFFHYFLSKIH